MSDDQKTIPPFIKELAVQMESLGFEVNYHDGYISANLGAAPGRDTPLEGIHEHWWVHVVYFKKEPYLNMGRSFRGMTDTAFSAMEIQTTTEALRLISSHLNFKKDFTQLCEEISLMLPEHRGSHS